MPNTLRNITTASVRELVEIHFAYRFSISIWCVEGVSWGVDFFKYQVIDNILR